jgi:hypothetical protein
LDGKKIKSNIFSLVYRCFCCFCWNLQPFR